VKHNSVTSVQTSIERRQRALLSQIATQRAIAARAEARLAELTAELHEVAPSAYKQLLERRTAAILRRDSGVAS
jgi:peptidoglycan hydrolase CwlO-like protein